jgi:hypothetical protein
LADAERLIVILDPDDRGDRPENLFARDTHLVGGFGKQRRLQEEAGLSRVIVSPPKASAWRLRFCRSRYSRYRLLELLFIDHGTDVDASFSAHHRPPEVFSFSVRAATNVSWMPSVTMTRDDAVQRWPVEKKPELRS